MSEEIDESLEDKENHDDIEQEKIVLEGLADAPLPDDWKSDEEFGSLDTTESVDIETLPVDKWIVAHIT